MLWVPLTALASLATTVTLPNGWERALAYNLAVEIAPEYGKEASATVQKVARDALAAIKRRNSPTIMLTSELPALLNVGHQARNIFTG